MAPDILVFSKARWDGLAPEDQALIAESARESVASMRRFWQERESQARKIVTEAGARFVQDVDKQSFQNAMKRVYDQFVTTTEQKALLRTIQELH
ncbi:MAG: hypothetical protein CGU28_04135 [Candidatus Dactylopiibacterium carminicum]|uniref:C4-dicarboxylate ABC transporter n=1 Tax=Candidatus Dactylopiibacterium carminicum TaxID=857335 RepID=A0A272EXH9_9RHOO|nr:hypothetical protein BGI27_03705 [Candidatus Dactylopiibacterium carminicum]PAS94809.1 MAG: hypothetical protein CGU29_02600 [Candidatus Dactylopiibacterium carminicum]PAS97733.1 MAG: hypothetical protein CGU28_04135 [Candidatus Dactylopiibacterium carminicum]PAT00173.1 MAG: hypothetical protein BSR46_03730 [Candidatus Dactylopiibacterium carminicum]